MKHRILIANDDGIDAPGLAVMDRIARRFTNDVWVVAPDFERSCASRSVSLADPVRIDRISAKRFSRVRGTSTDRIAKALERHLESDHR